MGMYFIYNRSEYEKFIKHGVLPFTIEDLDKAYKSNNGLIGVHCGVEYYLSKFLAVVKFGNWKDSIGSVGLV